MSAALLKKPKLALRVLAASLIAGSRNIQITRDPRRADTPEIARSISEMTSETEQAKARASLLESLGLDTERSVFGAGGEATGDLSDIFAKLLNMSDAQVMTILTVAVTESLAVGGKLIDTLGETLAVDVTDHWQPDMTLLSLANRRPVIAAIATEVLGDEAPRAHALTLTGARAVIAEALKTKKTKWSPRWTRFPAGRYIERGVTN